MGFGTFTFGTAVFGTSTAVVAGAAITESLALLGVGS